MLNEQSLDFIQRYLNNASPTGFEASGQRIWLDYIKPYIHTYQTDTYGSVVGIINPDAPYKVVIEAHADEISWFVNHITDDGFIYLTRNGGSDHQIAPSMRVNIHTRKSGVVKAVFGWPAIHTRRDSTEKAPSMTNIFLDCGVRNKKDVEALGVQIGNVVTFEDEFMVLNNDFFVGRALDNRMGGVVIAEVARMLHENGVKLPFGLYIVNSVQEEIGLRGAEMISRRIQPNCAIVTDVTHDTNTPMIDKIQHGDVKIGEGPSLTRGAAVHNRLLDFVLDVAEEKGIKVQLEAASRSTGTDTDAFAYSGIGVASCLISLPLRYMHTTVEMCHRNDVESVVTLIFEALQQIEAGTDWKYIQD